MQYESCDSRREPCQCTKILERESDQARLPGKGGVQDKNPEKEQEFTSEPSVSLSVKWE